jgi:hypothetical protein
VNSVILKNAYAFRTIDGLLYAGVQRASSGGPSKVVFEFNQKAGERTIGDLRIDAEIDAAGNVGTVEFESYSGEAAKGSGKFLSLALLSGEGCNDAGTACIVANGALLEVGVNLSQLLNEPGKRFAGIQITTPENSAAGTLRPMFSSSNADCVVEQGGFKKANCTVNDVRLTTIVRNSLVIDSGAGCTSNQKCFDAAGLNTGTSCTGPLPLAGTRGTQGTCTTGQTCLPTISFHATGQYIVGPQRYDIGLYISTDTDPNNDGARTGNCDRFDFPNNLTGQTVDLDGDTCGDVSPGTTPQVPFQSVTIPCIDINSDGLVDINHCETWANSADGVCGGAADVKAETSSKCFCGILAGACIATPNTDTCKVNSCAPRCSDHTGATDPACTTDADCTGTGAFCQDTLITVNKDDGFVCGPDPDPANPCDVNKTCVSGVCTGTGFAPGPGTVQCRASSCDTTLTSCCDVPEFCTGTSAVCPDDGFKPNTTVCRASSCGTGPDCCDVPELYTNGVCPADGFATDGHICRAAQNECDAAERCNGAATCPADFCGPAVARTGLFCSE